MALAIMISVSCISLFGYLAWETYLETQVEIARIKADKEDK